jgi:hypothetical protein
MIRRLLVVSIALALWACGTRASCAQTQSVQVPADQRVLSDILSRYNDLDAAAPNEIQRNRIDSEFHKEFCARIPSGDVSGWIGDIGSVDDLGPDKSIRLDMGVNIFDVHSGSLGIELSVGNHYAYGVAGKNTQPHPPTEIPVGSPLYEVVANFRHGDVVRFNGTFIPYVSAEACQDNDTTRFALVRFNSLQKLGWNIHLQ